MSLASRRWGRAERRGQILVHDPRFVKDGSQVFGEVGAEMTMLCSNKW
jgi:hypothetical protein